MGSWWPMRRHGAVPEYEHQWNDPPGIRGFHFHDGKRQGSPTCLFRRVEIPAGTQSGP